MTGTDLSAMQRCADEAALLRRLLEVTKDREVLAAARGRLAELGYGR